MWGIDATSTVVDGAVTVFIGVDHFDWLPFL
ncbi:hypothetical protein COMA1_90003 [Candidatus Nitrospira nitrosa]|uniref:Uncharacterized protein n=1 Tax=Candidatus Nitrospira nitrosa TaxID=1742972 RepID=A0A0S4LUM8_9BACT|nr:hypothetical protein COMA1_90003 [Candidatus Nitrospira nitrosa]